MILNNKWFLRVFIGLNGFLLVIILIWKDILQGNTFQLRNTMEYLAKISASDLDQPVKRVLFWSVPIVPTDYLPNPDECPVKCEYTNNRTLRPLEDFDALVFYYAGWEMPDPTTRRQDQIYMYFNLESQADKLHNINLTRYASFFNWTSACRLDADVPHGYGIRIPKEIMGSSEDLPNQEFVKQKKGLVSWIASNRFATTYPRYDYIQELAKYVPMDRYGKIYEKRIDHIKAIQVIRGHKFYMALENSICNGYISEKFWRALELGTVPIVMGKGVHYDMFVPPGSYIDASEFGSAKELGAYLLKLDQNDEEYLKYFEWKRFYTTRTLWGPNAVHFCDMCKKLHAPIKTKIYEDLNTWWKKDQCTKDINI